MATGVLKRMAFAAAAVASTALRCLAAEEAPAAKPQALEPPPPPAREWSVTLDSTFNSKYVWRGINVVDDPVWQPSVGFTWKGLTLNVWGNMDLTDVNGLRHDFTEVDYTLDYSHSVGKATFSMGAIRYVFPHTGFPTTQEVYAGIGFDAPLSPTFKVYRDVDEAKGAYYSFAVSHTLDNVVRLADSAAMSVALGASVGYSSSRHSKFYYAGTTDAGPADLTLSLGFPIAIGEHVTIKPAINYSRLLDSDIRRNMRGAGLDPTNCWFGLSFTFTY